MQLQLNVSASVFVQNINTCITKKNLINVAFGIPELFIAYMEGGVGVGVHRWCSFLPLDDRTLEVILDGYFGRADSG